MKTVGTTKYVRRAMIGVGFAEDGGIGANGDAKKRERKKKEKKNRRE
jgi:FtsZ-interacting cell division protein YlmF